MPLSSASASTLNNPNDEISNYQLGSEEGLPTLSKDFIDFSNLQIAEPDGTVLTFDSEEDMSSYLSAKNSNKFNQMETLAVGETLVGTETKKMQFVSYHTSSWGQLPGYTVDNGSTLGISGKIPSKWGDVGVSFTKTYNVSVTYPADKKRWSKLAGYADVKIERYKVFKPNMPTSYYVNKTKVLEKYIKVKYK